MKPIAFAAALLPLLPLPALAAAPDRVHVPAQPMPPIGGAPAASAPPAFSAAVQAGKTLYVSGALDIDPATGKPGTTPEASARFVLDAVKRSVEAGGMTMDDLVWVQVFATDLSSYSAFNAIYRTYFKGELPARAFLGVDHLLAKANFEVMGIAVAKGK